MTTDATERRRLGALERAELAAYQLGRLHALVERILPHNPLYAEKLAAVPQRLSALEELRNWPYTFKEELLWAAGDERDHATNLTYPLERYVRFHRTSGTRGRPLVVLDTAEDWQWWLEGWQYVLDAADVGPQDRVLLAFSFGPFIGFWSAFDAAAARGAMVVPAGGLGTLARLDLVRSSGATVLLSTPSYALHLAEVAAANQIDTAALAVRRVIVAGEPGGSVPAIRDRIAASWNARVIDHGGATEVGPWGFADEQGTGLHVNEAEFVAEFLAVDSGSPAAEGELSELVLTTLGRSGAPVIRYRTGDLVRPRWSHDRHCRFVLLDGGVLGRADDMLVVRGVNIFPSSLEQVLRSFPEVVEYRITVRRHGELDDLLVEIEDRLERPERVSQELRLRLGLRVEVRLVPLGALPRFEGKGRRFVDERSRG